MNLEAALAAVCTALSLSFIWPQVFKVYRQRSVEGLSPAGTLHGVAGSTLWTTYGLVTAVPALVVSNATILLAMVAIGAAQVRHRVLPAGRLAGMAAIATGVGVGSALVSPVLTGALAIAVGATSILPQTRHVLRAADLSGVSVAMYGLLVVTAIGWAGYGLMIGDVLVAAPNVLVLPCAVLIATRAARAQRGGSPFELAPALATVEA